MCASADVSATTNVSSCRAYVLRIEMPLVCSIFELLVTTTASEGIVAQHATMHTAANSELEAR